MFVVLLSIQPLFRLRAIGKSADILPRLAALVAVCVPLMFMLLERAPPSISFNVIAVIVSLFANVMLLVTVSFLGRSLSVMPEARRLVQSGPYAIVRHPIYTGFVIGMVGTAVAQGQVRSILAVVLLVASYLRKTKIEETWLVQQFGDEYRTYQKEVGALIPGIK